MAANSTSFKKGPDLRRNAGGRPKGTKNFTTRVREVMERIAVLEERQVEDVAVDVPARLRRVDAINEKGDRAGAEQKIGGDGLTGVALKRGDAAALLLSGGRMLKAHGRLGIGNALLLILPL